MLKTQIHILLFVLLFSIKHSLVLIHFNDTKKTEISKDNSGKENTESEKENKTEKLESEQFLTSTNYKFELIGIDQLLNAYRQKNYTFFNNSYCGPPPECYFFPEFLSVKIN